jgi:hypothetical protein
VPFLPPDNAVLPFVCWEEDANEDGNTFVWLEFELDSTLFKVMFMSEKTATTENRFLHSASEEHAVHISKRRAYALLDYNHQLLEA